MKIFTRPHRRFNQLTGEWVLVSPQRAELAARVIKAKVDLELPEYDADCYLCPGNERVSGIKTPDYNEPYVFDDDYPALFPQREDNNDKLHHLLHAEQVVGVCRILSYAPEHNITFATMDLDQIHRVVNAWSAETGALGERYSWVQIFARRGAETGGHNYHPHCQIWATDIIPTIGQKEDVAQKEYFKQHGVVLLQEYAELELQQKTRVVVSNEYWNIVVPFWASRPYETLLVPRRHVHNFPELTVDERDALASILKRLFIRYSNLFGHDFSYTMGWHGAFYNRGDVHHWQLHGHIYPVLKAGYALLAEPQLDLTPEGAAEFLRALE